MIASCASKKMRHNIVLNEKVSGSKKHKKALKMCNALISHIKNIYTQLDAKSNSMILLPRKYEDDHVLKNTIIFRTP